MTKEMIDEVRKLSREYLETKEEIKRQEGSRENFEEALQEKIEADFINKKNFLDSNAELTGLTLEFRNIFGIEGGIYEEKRYTGHPFIYPPGTPNAYKYDSHLLVDTCGVLHESGEVTEPIDNPFFVDEARKQEGSPYYIPFCPPNLSAWCGNKYYKGHTKMFYKTEHMMVKFIDSLYSVTEKRFRHDGYINREGFNYEVPVEFYSNANGNITKEIYKINASRIPKAPGGGYYTPSSVSLLSGKGEVGYSYTGDLSQGSIITFRLSPKSGTKGINSSALGYAYVYKISGGKAYLDLLGYNAPLVSRVSTKTKNKGSTKKPETEVVKNIGTFSISFSNRMTVDNSNTILNEALATYERIHLDSVLYYLEKIQVPDAGTKESIRRMRNLKNAFTQYRRGSKTLASLISDIKSRRNWIYDNNQSGKTSSRAQQIHDNLRNSDVFEKVYDTLNARINKRTGTLRELMKYAFNTAVASGIADLKRETLVSFGNYMVVFSLIRDVKNSDYIEIELEEGETIEDFYLYAKWMSEVYIVTDNENQPFFKTRIADIVERGDLALGIYLADKVPITKNYKIDEGARLVRLF